MTAPKRILQRVLVHSLKHNAPRQAINLFYDQLSWTNKHRLYYWTATQFTDATPLDPGLWEVHFAGKKIVVPVNLRMDWDFAAGILGTDFDTKQTYEHLLKSNKPKCFFDIGTNRGSHSLLMLAHQVRTISFEPNEVCHQYFKQCAALNGFKEEIHTLALSDANGTVDLCFPEDETGLGTIQDSTKNRLQTRNLRRVTVKKQLLDDFVKQTGLSPDLMKIDTEGHELHVLRGGQETLKTLRPFVIFECWSHRQVANTNRHEVFEFLSETDYRIASLPKLLSLTKQQFADSEEINFAAIPNSPRSLA